MKESKDIVLQALKSKWFELAAKESARLSPDPNLTQEIDELTVAIRNRQQELQQKTHTA